MTGRLEVEGEKVKWSAVLPTMSLVMVTVLMPSTTLLSVTLTEAERTVPGSWSPTFLSLTFPVPSTTIV